MSRRGRWSLVLCAALLLLYAAPASAHGGLPVSTRILIRPGGQLYVPTLYWGIFAGTDGGEWRWICDEAINSYKLRDVLQGGDGTLYATDAPGLTISGDGGCNFRSVPLPGCADAAGAELAQLDVSAVLADPQAPARVYVAGAGFSSPSGLYKSDDSGCSWRRLYQSADPIYGAALGTAPGGGGTLLHLLTLGGAERDQAAILTSADGGAGWSALPLQPAPTGTAGGQVRLLAADRRDGAVLYVYLQGDTQQVLLRVDTRARTFAEILRINAALFYAEVDLATDRLLVATGEGVYYSDGALGAGPLQRSPALQRAQCLTVQGATLYACAWNYDPDKAAVARSRDDGLTFQRVFQYADTRGVYACPADSRVAQVCPASWATNASLLGIDVRPADGGARPDGGTGTGGSSSGCSVGRATPGARPGGLAALLLLLCLSVRRRRGPARPGSES